jgi:hypothetical protein
LFSKFPEEVSKSDISGIVIAGFGEKDTFPSLIEFQIDMVVKDKLKYVESYSTKINFDRAASIIPFAQQEMVSTFMEGVSPDYRENEEIYLNNILKEYIEIVLDNLKGYSESNKKKLKNKLSKINSKILKKHSQIIDKYIQEKYADPVVEVVAVLPKDELAAMAESLVSLTSFKRKVTMESETVGGPIDVVVISKGDGFIWIKRKYYFKMELNPEFSKR